jgi:hypothetical protein
LFAKFARSQFKSNELDDKLEVEAFNGTDGNGSTRTIALDEVIEQPDVVRIELYIVFELGVKVIELPVPTFVVPLLHA